jgi:hypothetical protein
MKWKIAWISCFECILVSSIRQLLIGKLELKEKLDS